MNKSASSVERERANDFKTCTGTISFMDGLTIKKQD